MKRRVAITGIGPVSAIGIGRDEFFSRLWAGQTNRHRIPPSLCPTYSYKTGFFSPFPVFSVSDFIPTRFEAIMENPAKAAVVAACLAVRDADLTEWDGAAVILGVGMGALNTAFSSFTAHVNGPTVSRFNRMVIPMHMSNAPAAWVSILLGIHGPSFTINASCASGTVAIGEAFRRIADGHSEVVLAGGTECLQDSSGAIMRGFDALGALTGSPDGLPRPFSQERSGFLFSEGGACILVLEEWTRACSRGATIYAEIAGYSTLSEAHSIVQMDESGSGVLRLLMQIRDGQRIDYLNAHGTGTVQNDQIEAQAIQNVFGHRQEQPFINSTKGLLGHTVGASGALEAAVAAFSLKNQTIHGFPTGTPLADLNLVTESCPAAIATAISLSFGFGGHNAGLLLRRSPEKTKVGGKES